LPPKSRADAVFGGRAGTDVLGALEARRVGFDCGVLDGPPEQVPEALGVAVVGVEHQQAVLATAVMSPPVVG
jgi:hypothetical protein